MRRTLFAAVLATLTVIAPSARAEGEGPVVLGGPGSYIANYTTPVAVAQVGGPLTYVHADIQAHDVIADGVYGPNTQPWCVEFPVNRCPVFWSALLGSPGARAPVLGLENTTAGQRIPFYCSLHNGMSGTLVIAPKP